MDFLFLFFKLKEDIYLTFLPKLILSLIFHTLLIRKKKVGLPRWPVLSRFLLILALVGQMLREWLQPRP